MEDSRGTHQLHRRSARWSGVRPVRKQHKPKTKPPKPQNPCPCGDDIETVIDRLDTIIGRLDTIIDILNEPEAETVTPQITFDPPVGK